MDIDRGVRNGVMAHHGLYSGQRYVLMVHLGGKGVAKHTGGYSGLDADLSALVFDNALNTTV